MPHRRQARSAITLYDPGGQGVKDVAFSPDGRQLAVGDSNGSIYLWRTATDELVGTYTGTSEAQVWGVAFSPDGKLLAIADGDGQIYVRVTSQLVS